MRADALARRDGWRCWICGGELDRTVAATDPTAPTIDHVLPRALGGSSEPSNLRLAHRRCNGRRGSRLPELTWPSELPLSAPADLLTAARRGLRRRGSWEVVALAGDSQDAERAAQWLDSALTEVFGPAFETRTRRAGGPVLVEMRSPVS
ncbi:MAG: HNH endonuclease [Actinomycetes bacterium]